MMVNGWLLVILITVATVTVYLCTYCFRRKEKNEQYEAIKVGDCFRLTTVSLGKRPEYCVVVDKRIIDKRPIIEYKIITYDHFFKRYEEGDVIFSSVLNEFIEEYTPIEENIEYFKYEKFS